MSDKDKIVLQKIAKYTNEALSYADSMDYDSFISDRKTLSAVAFTIGQIGELAKNVSEDMQIAASDINWRGMRGLRNRIIHDYENIDLKMLWEVITVDLPVLSEKLNALL